MPFGPSGRSREFVNNAVLTLEALEQSSYFVDCLWMLAYRNTEEQWARAPRIC